MVVETMSFLQGERSSTELILLFRGITIFCVEGLTIVHRIAAREIIIGSLTLLFHQRK